VNATREEVIAAARQADGSRFYFTLAHRLRTPVGERGVRLSVDRSSVLTLARAIVRDPEVLIFG
jgi:ABC-type multidrug transport system fused ATPase/permease subunit